jgi:hypothetical protein
LARWFLCIGGTILHTHMYKLFYLRICSDYLHIWRGPNFLHLDRGLSTPLINLSAHTDRKLVIFLCISALHNKNTIFGSDTWIKNSDGVQRKCLRIPSYACMLIPKWAQTLFWNGESQMGVYQSACPFSYGKYPYGNGYCSLGRPLSHAGPGCLQKLWLKNQYYPTCVHLVQRCWEQHSLSNLSAFFQHFLVFFQSSPS